MRTQCDQIHDLLKSGPVTARHVYHMCGSLRAAARIYELRSRGVPVQTRMIRKGRAMVAEYWIAA